MNNEKKTRLLMVWMLALSSLFLISFTDTIDTSLPAGSDDPAEADDNMRRIQGGFQEILAVEHNVDKTGTVITGDGTHTAITADSVAVSGAVTVGTTLGVTGVATLADSSQMATSAAPTADADLANKKYADDAQKPSGRLYLNGAQNNVGDGSWIKVDLDAIDSDFTDSIESIANERITPAVVGYYLVTGQIYFTTGLVADKVYQGAIYKNGVAVRVTSVHSGVTGTAALTIRLSDIIKLDADDYVELYVKTNAGVSTADLTTGSSFTFLSLQRVR